MTPTQRTLQMLRRTGFSADTAERWISIDRHPAGGVRRDLFGFIDLIAIGEGSIIAVQATSHANVPARRSKILSECSLEAKRWLSAPGGRIQIWGWKKHKVPIDGRWWRPRVVELTLKDIV